MKRTDLKQIIREELYKLNEVKKYEVEIGWKGVKKKSGNTIKTIINQKTLDQLESRLSGEVYIDVYDESSKKAFNYDAILVKLRKETEYGKIAFNENKLNEVNKKAEAYYSTLEKHQKELKSSAATMKKYSKGGYLYLTQAIKKLNDATNELVNDALFEGADLVKLKKKDGSGKGQRLNKGKQCDEDEIAGGKGDKLVSDEVCPKELAVGIAVEMEHTNDKEKAKEIALDHLSEDPEYYSKLINSGLADEKDAIVLAKKYGLVESGAKYKVGDKVKYLPKISGLSPKKTFTISRVSHKTGKEDMFSQKGWVYSFKNSNLSASEDDIKKLNEVKKE